MRSVDEAKNKGLTPSVNLSVSVNLHIDVNAAGNAVLAGAFVGLDDDSAHALDDRTVMHRSSTSEMTASSRG